MWSYCSTVDTLPGKDYSSGNTRLCNLRWVFFPAVELIAESNLTLKVHEHWRLVELLQLQLFKFDIFTTPRTVFESRSLIVYYFSQSCKMSKMLSVDVKPPPGVHSTHSMYRRHVAPPQPQLAGEPYRVWYLNKTRQTPKASPVRLDVKNKIRVHTQNSVSHIHFFRGSYARQHLCGLMLVGTKKKIRRTCEVTSPLQVELRRSRHRSHRRAVWRRLQINCVRSSAPSRFLCYDHPPPPF